MKQIYSNVRMVLVDSGLVNNLLYLPLDMLMQSAGAPAPTQAPAGNDGMSSLPSSTAPVVPDARSRDGSRSRDRDVR